VIGWIAKDQQLGNALEEGSVFDGFAGATEEAS
jgi:hypothetical protein